VAETNTNNVVFSLSQMLAHHTRGGCPLRTGDLLATGTLSGSIREEEGCFFEITRNGALPYEMRSVSSPQKKITRTFLEDGDVLTFTARADNSDRLGPVGFGACSERVLPANQMYALGRPTD
jgi:fumarylacetoacetase